MLFQLGLRNWLPLERKQPLSLRAHKNTHWGGNMKHTPQREGRKLAGPHLSGAWIWVS